MQNFKNRIKKLEVNFQPVIDSGSDGLSKLSRRDLLNLYCKHPPGSFKISKRAASLWSKEGFQWNIRTDAIPDGKNAVCGHCYNCGYQEFLFDGSNLLPGQWDHYQSLLRDNDIFGEGYHQADFYAYGLIKSGHLDFVPFTDEIKEFYESKGGDLNYYRSLKRMPYGECDND